MALPTSTSWVELLSTGMASALATLKATFACCWKHWLASCTMASLRSTPSSKCKNVNVINLELILYVCKILQICKSPHFHSFLRLCWTSQTNSWYSSQCHIPHPQPSSFLPRKYCFLNWFNNLIKVYTLYFCLRNLTTLSTIWTGWSGLMELYLRTSFEALQIDFCILAQKSLVQYRVESCDYQCCFALTLALDIFQTQTTLPSLRAPVVSMWICVLLNWFLPSTHLTSKHKQNYLQYKHKFSFKYLSI